MLHPEHQDRAYRDSLGLPVCNKRLMTALDVRRHMQHRHKNEWESIEEDKKLQLEAEEREVRRSIIANAAPKAAPEPQPAAAPVPHAGAAADRKSTRLNSSH